eukprot:scaffold196_cov371-Prasinococcus_capsulatus_cf.AAC.9
MQPAGGAPWRRRSVHLVLLDTRYQVNCSRSAQLYAWSGCYVGEGTQRESFIAGTPCASVRAMLRAMKIGTDFGAVDLCQQRILHQQVTLYVGVKLVVENTDLRICSQQANLVTNWRQRDRSHRGQLNARAAHLIDGICIDHRRAVGAPVSVMNACKGAHIRHVVGILHVCSLATASVVSRLVGLDIGGAPVKRTHSIPGRGTQKLRDSIRSCSRDGHSAST